MEKERTSNQTDFSEVAKGAWYLSMRQAAPKQTLDVKFENGRTYKYNGTGIVNVGDPVVIKYGGATSYMMGNVVSVVDGRTLKPGFGLKPFFTFTTNPGKLEIKRNAASVTGMENTDKIDELYRLGHDIFPYNNFRPVDYLVESVLNAISVLAFPDIAPKDAENTAIKFLKEEKNLPGLIFGHAFVSRYYQHDFLEYVEVALTGFYPGWKEQIDNCKFRKDAFIEKTIEFHMDDDNVYYLYFEEGMDELADFFDKSDEFRILTNELVYRSALSIIIRGGFVNLLKAALSVEMPIQGFYGKLIEFAEEIGSKECCEILKEHLAQK